MTTQAPDLSSLTGDVREAASVILLREGAAGPEQPLEIFLVRRHAKAGFMAGAYVFPGGIRDDRDRDDPRATAARELFEEAGVLLAEPAIPASLANRWRGPVDEGEADLHDLLRAHGSALAIHELHYFAHWITPSAEKRRYSARFYCALMPPAQAAVACAKETHEGLWITADDALERRAELRLPPPQVRSLDDLREATHRGWDDVVALCAERAEHPFPILPRLAPQERGFALLLPWDPDYERDGQGDSLPIPPRHPLATGPTRFSLGDDGWSHFTKPGKATTS